MRKPLLIIVLLVFATATAVVIRSDEVSDVIANCTNADCHGGSHQRVYMEAMNVGYQHEIVLTRCDLCHVKISLDDTNMTEYSSPEGQQGVLFALGGLTAELYRVKVTATDSFSQKSLRYETTLDLGEPIGVRGDDGTGPVMTEPQVTKVVNTGFIAVTLEWKTDEYATSVARYGPSDSYGQAVYKRGNLIRDHKVVIAGLSVNSEYHYQITVIDVFGNKTVSKDYVIDTGEAVAVDVPQDEAEPAPVVESVGFFKTGDGRLYMETTANKDVRFDAVVEEDMLLGDHGYGFLTARQSMIKVCVGCHEQNVSHPVDVKGDGRKIITPENLPTIEDGVLTCVTCHDPHGGNKKYFAWFDFKRDICIKCHLESAFD